MPEHDLKTDPEPFNALWLGLKRYEVRKNDRGFHEGDWLVLREHDPKTGRFSGREVKTEIVYMTRGGKYGMPEGLCVLGLGVMMKRTRSAARPTARAL